MSRDLTLVEIDQLLVGSALAARNLAVDTKAEPVGWTGVAAWAAVVLAVPAAGALKFFLF